MKADGRFVTAVAEMRHLQREYFRTKDRNTLLKAKNVERKVDAMLEELSREEGNEQDGNLFNQ